MLGRTTATLKLRKWSRGFSASCAGHIRDWQERDDRNQQNREEPKSAPGLHDSQTPPLDSGPPSLLRRQRRIEVAAKGAIPVGTLQPRRHGPGTLFVTAPAFLR